MMFFLLQRTHWNCKYFMKTFKKMWKLKLLKWEKKVKNVLSIFYRKKEYSILISNIILYICAHFRNPFAKMSKVQFPHGLPPLAFTQSLQDSGLKMWPCVTFYFLHYLYFINLAVLLVIFINVQYQIRSNRSLPM